MAGLTTCPNLGAYVASKHAVVGLSEVLYRDLEALGSRVGVSVLCPGGVVTRIMSAERNWPSRLGPAPSTLSGEYPDFPERKQPEEVADQVFEAIAALGPGRPLMQTAAALRRRAGLLRGTPW